MEGVAVLKKRFTIKSRKKLLIPLITVIDIYLLGPWLTKGHPKSACAIHPIQGRYLMGKGLGYVQKYSRDHILFLV
jgi:hypothetical protein